MEGDLPRLGLGWMLNLETGLDEMSEFGDFVGTYCFGYPIPVGLWRLWKFGEVLDLDGVLGWVLVWWLLGMDFGKFLYPTVEDLVRFSCRDKGL
jgi:hypothetical protein